MDNKTGIMQGVLKVHYISLLNKCIESIFKGFICFNACTVHPSLYCTMTKKCTIIEQIITLLNVSTLSCHPQGACNQYLAKLHKYFKCSC